MWNYVDILIFIRFDIKNPNFFQEFMYKSDVTKSGDLDLNEFVTYLTEHEKQLHIVFSSLDEDQDGKINVKEVVSAFKKLGIAITEAEAKTLMQR